MAITKATIGGVPILTLADVGWTYTCGVEPHQRVFVVNRVDLPTLLRARNDPNGVDLVAEGPDVGDTWTVRKLWPLRSVPANHPDQVGILIADGRWRWRYKWVVRRFNVLRRTGTRTLNTENRVLEALQFATNDLKYAPFSLRPPDYVTPYELRDVVREILSVVTEDTAFVAESLFQNQVEVQGLEFDDPGPEAVARLLGMFPSAGCRMDDFGNAQIFNYADGSEEALVLSMGAPFVGCALPERVSMALERPAAVHVHFTCEDELRFDFVEGGTRETDGRWLRNVMPLPVTMTFQGRSVAAGTWMEITDELLAAFVTAFPPVSQLGNTIAGIQAFNLSTLRHIWSNGQYNLYYDAFATSSADPVWAGILDALRDHYRQTFQINQRWADRIIGFYPKRVALLDPVNNVWAPAAVWANHALIPSYRRVGKTDGDKTELCYNRTPFPNPTTGSVPATDLTTIRNQQAVAAVKMLDEQLGIFHVTFAARINGGATIDVAPSNLEGFDSGSNTTFALPSADVDLPLKVLSHCRLVDSHALSIVLTCLTGAPNNLDQTWDEIVTLEQAREKLPANVQKQLPDALGPVMHVRVGASVQTARFAWMDGGEADQITAAILGTGSRRAYAANLFVNDRYVREVAEARAAQIYSSLVDHVQGEPVAKMNHNLQPVGRTAAVEHGVRPDGVAFTKVTLAPPRRGIDFWALLPEFARRYIRGILPRQ